MLAAVLALPIVGGSPVPPGKWPDAAAVIGSGGTCSGVVVAPDVVLTAGHCSEIQPEAVVVNAVDFATGTRYAVAQTIAYPSWSTSYDVAAIVLAEPLDVPPRALGASCTHIADAMAVDIVGFGLTEDDGHGTNTQLHEVLASVDDASCTSPGCNAAIAPGGELVVGGDGLDSCFGDSGGPIYLTTPRGTFAVGVVSRGLPGEAEPCGDGGIYVRTDRIAEWLASATGVQIDRDPCAEDPPDDGGCNAGGGRSSLLVGLAILSSMFRKNRA